MEHFWLKTRASKESMLLFSFFLSRSFCHYSKSSDNKMVGVLVWVFPEAETEREIRRQAVYLEGSGNTS